MKKGVRRIVIICVIIVVVCLCGMAYVRTQRPEKMTVEETVQWLMEYIYGEDYLALSTVYYSKEDGPRLPVYNSEWINCPIYEFELPNETIPIRRQIFCVGETKDGNYLVLGLFAWNYTEGKDGQRIYTHANFASRYAVNRITKEIIQERDRDENGDMIYDSRYDKFFSENALVYKDYYE